MRVGEDRILVKLIVNSNTEGANMVDPSELMQEAEVIAVGIDRDGMLEKLVKEGDIVILAPLCTGLPYYLEDGTKCTIIRKHNIELIK